MGWLFLGLWNGLGRGLFVTRGRGGGGSSCCRWSCWARKLLPKLLSRSCRKSSLLSLKSSLLLLFLKLSLLLLFLKLLLLFLKLLFPLFFLFFRPNFFFSFTAGDVGGGELGKKSSIGRDDACCATSAFPVLRSSMAGCCCSCGAGEGLLPFLPFFFFFFLFLRRPPPLFFLGGGLDVRNSFPFRSGIGSWRCVMRLSSSRVTMAMAFLSIIIMWC